MRIAKSRDAPTQLIGPDIPRENILAVHGIHKPTWKIQPEPMRVIRNGQMHHLLGDHAVKYVVRRPDQVPVE